MVVLVVDDVVGGGGYRERRGDSWSGVVVVVETEGMCEMNFWDVLERGLIVRWTLATYSSMYSSAICHFIPFPGSSVRRGTLTKALLRDKLCRIEFYGQHSKEKTIWIPASRFWCIDRMRNETL